MATTVEDKVNKLKEKMKKLELEMERTHAITACANLMDKYQYYHMRGMRTEETHLFALKTPGACVEMLWGIYDEPAGVLRWKRMEGYGKPRSFTKGMYPNHCMTTPIIEVAKDGQTARGLWIMIGGESGKRPGEQEAKANWAAGQFAMDFIKENGEWKIWKYNTTGLIYSPFEIGWHKENKIPEGMLKTLPDEYKPDRSASYPWMWNPDDKFQNIPPIPLPYETWDDSLACIPVPGKKWDIKK